MGGAVIQATCSVNCIWPACGSKNRQSGRATHRSAKVATSAIHRAADSVANDSTTTPARGTTRSSESQGKELVIDCWSIVHGHRHENRCSLFPSAHDRCPLALLHK